MSDSEDTYRGAAASPFVYLSAEPTADEQRLIEACGQHRGAETPFHMLAKVALRLHEAAALATRSSAFFRRGRRFLLAGVSVAAVNLGALGVYLLNRTEAAGVSREHAAAVERDFDEYRKAMDQRLHELQLDIRELRAELRRLSDKDPPTLTPPHPPTSELLEQPDRFSMAGPGAP